MYNVKPLEVTEAMNKILRFDNQKLFLLAELLCFHNMAVAERLEFLLSVSARERLEAERGAEILSE
jgi:hypothetical protein